MTPWVLGMVGDVMGGAWLAMSRVLGCTWVTSWGGPWQLTTPVP